LEKDVVKIKKVRLQNYCGYRDVEYDFSFNGQIKQLAIFYGPNGGGKCLNGNTRITSKEYGCVEIQSLFKGQKLQEDTWYSLYQPIEIDINGKTAKVEEIYYSGKRKSVEVKTRAGYLLEGSYDQHRILGVKNGKIDWLYLRDIKKGDIVCISRKSVFPESCDVSLPEAVVAGYMIAEGSSNRDRNWRFHNTDKDVLRDFDSNYFNAFQKYPGGRNSICGARKSRMLHAEAIDRLVDIGVAKVLSGEKSIPQLILSGTKEIICSFLRAYYEGDGGVDDKTISCCSKSYQLIHEIQLLLLKLGIIAKLRKRTAKLNYTDKYPDGYGSWMLTISGQRDILKYSEEIGFASSRKQEELNVLLQKIISKSINPNFDIIPATLIRGMVSNLRSRVVNIPYSKPNRRSFFFREDYHHTSNGLHMLSNWCLSTVKTGVSKHKLESCINTIDKVSKEDVLSEIEEEFEWLKEDYYFDTIQFIETKECELFDLSVNEYHCYWTNGFISHNSTLLEAVAMLSAPALFRGRTDFDLMFRRLTFHVDYNMITDGMVNYNQKTQTFKDGEPMEISGLFEVDGEEKRVVLDSKKGMRLNELSPDGRYAFAIDADKPVNMNRFQINDKYASIFLDMVKAVYGFDCWLDAPVREMDRSTGEEVVFYTDFIVHKYPGSHNESRVHFKRMSAGEKKIATMLAQLCGPLQKDNYDIFLMDNLEQHIYFKRHMITVEKLIEHFSDKQILATTHSGVIVANMPDIFLYDIERYKAGELGRMERATHAATL